MGLVELRASTFLHQVLKSTGIERKNIYLRAKIPEFVRAMTNLNCIQ